MKAKIISAVKQTIGEKIHIVTEVDFQDKTGKTVYKQYYGQLPENVDPKYFQRQADVMQNDFDQALAVKKAAEAAAKANATADEALGKVHKLILGDAVQLKEAIKK